MTHFLLAPSSLVVTMHINGMSVEKWIEVASEQIKQATFNTEFAEMPIKIRQKPRLGNQWWQTDIRDELKGCQALVTNMSLSAVDAVLNMTPVFAHKRNIVSFICGDNIWQDYKTYETRT